MRLTYRLSALGVRLLARLLIGLRVRGVEKIPERGKLIIAANHQSYLDPPILGACLRREVHYLAKADLFKYPVFGTIIRHLNALPLKRKDPDIQAVRQAVEILQGGEAIVLFPEGGLGPTVDLRRAYSGVGFLAYQTGADVYPVYIKNTRKAWARVFKRCPIEINFGDPIRCGKLSTGDTNKKQDAYLAFSTEVMQRIAALKAVNG